MERKKDYYKTITKRLVVVIFCLSALPIITFGISASHSIEQTNKLKLRELAVSTTEHRAEVISMFLREKINLLKMLVSLYNEAFLLEQENLERLFLGVAQSGDIVDLQVIDAVGMQHSYVGPYHSLIRGKRYDAAPWFKETLIQGVHVSDVFTGYRNVPHFVVAVTNPLKSYVLRATINSSFFNSLLYSAQLGPRGDAYIINRQGAFQTPSLLADREISDELKWLITFDSKTNTRITEADIYSTNWLANDQWLLVVKANIDDSFNHFTMLRRRLIYIISAVTLLSVIGAGLASHAISKNLEKSDREHAALSMQLAQVEKMATIGRLAAGVAHEINNPLQMITSQAGWIGELLPDEEQSQIKNYEEYCRAVEQIKHHVKRAGTITHRLLGFSRKISEQKESVDINQLIEESVSFIEKEAEYNNIQIDRDLDKTIPLTMSDGPQLQQVFLNLINNSIDAIQRNGRIVISSRIKDSGNLSITFADNGPGVPQENIKQIFDPFFTTKSTGKGTGLGLYISYDIIKKLGGSISVANIEERGAVFSISLPLRKPNM